MSQTITARPDGYGHRLPGAVVAVAVLAVSLLIALAAFVLAGGDDSSPARPAQPAVEAPAVDLGFTNDTQVLRNCPPRTACPS